MVEPWALPWVVMTSHWRPWAESWAVIGRVDGESRAAPGTVLAKSGPKSQGTREVLRMMVGALWLSGGGPGQQAMDTSPKAIKPMRYVEERAHALLLSLGVPPAPAPPCVSPDSEVWRALTTDDVGTCETGPRGTWERGGGAGGGPGT